MNSELVVLGFPSKGGAKNFLTDLLPLQDHHLIRLEEACLAVKDEKGKVFFTQKPDLAAHGLVGGSLWGTLTGALFFEPFLGLIFGGTLGLLTGVLLSEQQTSNLNLKFVRRMAQQALEPSQSALFILVSKVTIDKVLKKMSHHEATLISTSLGLEEEKKLRDGWSRVHQAGPLSVYDNIAARKAVPDWKRETVSLG